MTIRIIGRIGKIWEEKRLKIKKREIVFGLILGVVIVSIGMAGEIKKLPTGRLQVIFCDVGQGDAIFIKTPAGKDILIDGGPDEKVLTCLSNHMIFWDKNIEMVFLTHSHADHITGILSVLDRYSVSYFFKTEIENNSAEYKELATRLKSLKFKSLSVGDKIKTDDGVEIDVLWPLKSYSNTDVNLTSLILEIKSKDETILLMGDAGSEVQGEILQENPGLGRVDVLKVPHHGSKTALGEDFLKRIRPKVAAISVGKNNQFGHPAKETLEQLGKIGAKIVRTDLEGEVEIRE